MTQAEFVSFSLPDCAMVSAAQDHPCPVCGASKDSPCSPVIPGATHYARMLLIKEAQWRG